MSIMMEIFWKCIDALNVFTMQLAMGPNLHSLIEMSFVEANEL